MKVNGEIYLISKKEAIEVYNALCCLNTAIREKQKRRAKYIQKIISKWEQIYTELE